MNRLVHGVVPVLVAGLAAGLLAAPSPAAAQEGASPMIHGAEVRVSAKKWEEAQQFLEEEALPAFPNEPELHYWLGVVYAQGSNRDTEKAALAFAQARELSNPEDAELRGKIDTAVKAIWGPLVNAAAKAADAGEYEKAEGLLVQATEINPEGAEAWINLGTVYLRSQQNAEAVAAYEKAIALQPDNSTLSYNLGITYHQLARDALAAGDTAKGNEYLAKAEETYQQYLAANPGDVGIITSLAGLYQERGDEAKVRETLGAVFEADSAGRDDYFNAGLVFMKGEDYPNAERAFGQVVAMTDSTDAPALESLGLVLIQQKKYDPAIAALQRLIELQPENPIAHEYIAFAYRDAGRRDEAAAAFAKSEELKQAQGAGAGSGASAE